MMYFIVLCLVFAFLFLMPFFVSVLFNANGAIRPLRIHSDNVKDPRYFAHSFRSKIEHAVQQGEPEPGKLMLSHPESYIKNNGMPFTNRHCDQVVYEGSGDFFSTDSVFEKEIYAAQDAELGYGSSVRAIACLGHLQVDDGVEIERWADGEKGCLAGNGCDLGVSFTSRGPIAVGKDCLFRRLFSPMVYVGPGLPPRSITDGHARTEGLAIKDILFDADEVPEGETLDNTIITRFNLLLRERATVHGSIKSDGNVRIMTGSVVTGSVFADGSIVLEPDVQIHGNVFSQEQVVIGPDTVVGLRGRVKSVVARKSIYLTEGSTVYGYVGSEDESRTIAEDDFPSYANAYF